VLQVATKVASDEELFLIKESDCRNRCAMCAQHSTVEFS
jgi:hypothetical protein